MNALDQPSILVIDPDPVSLTAISAMLNCAGYQVYCAKDRAAALRGARDIELDLIVCDEEIDESQGAMLVMELRSIPDRHDVPIMYLSQRQLPDIISRPHDGGAAYHIKKPLEPNLMLEMVKQALVELPLINHQVGNQLNKPHFPVTAVTKIDFGSSFQHQ